MLSLSEPRAPRLEATLGLRSASSTGRPGPVLSSPPQGPADRRGQSLNSTPQLDPLSHSARFFSPGSPPVSRQTSPPPVPQPAHGVLVSEPIWDRPAGPKTHSRRTGGKLGQTRRARQGLVRVPESNTKYGGKGGITGGDAAPVMAPSISESSGIPKGKKLFRRVERQLHPLFTGQVFFQPRGLHWGDSRMATERGGLACRRTRGRMPG